MIAQRCWTSWSWKPGGPHSVEKTRYGLGVLVTGGRSGMNYEPDFKCNRVGLLRAGSACFLCWSKLAGWLAWWGSPLLAGSTSVRADTTCCGC